VTLARAAAAGYRAAYGTYVEAHGGYLFRIDEPDGVDWLSLARQALSEDGEDAEDASLVLSSLTPIKVWRVAYDAPFSYGAKGAHWYGSHHALARALSKQIKVTVHAYVLDPESHEAVVAFGGGQQVGGETLSYDEADVWAAEAMDDAAYQKVVSRWPLGRLAKIMGVPRDALLKLPRAPCTLIDLG
jgi:hypothetical protein